jgi:hypothetical protein
LKQQGQDAPIDVIIVRDQNPQRMALRKRRVHDLLAVLRFGPGERMR